MGWFSVEKIYKDNFKVLKEIIILYPAKISIKGEGTIKAFLATQEFIKFTFS